MDFKLISDFTPTGDQPEAIRQLSAGLIQGVPFQTLLGVTGSGKTFTIANVIEQLNRPVLVLSHNKTLAAQLYGEFRQFFPDNAVEYFVSYYDYYQPEAYLPVTDTYIEKDLSINDELEKLRLSATSSLLSGRRDVIVVSSVSCLFGIGNPDDFRANTVHVIKGARTGRNVLMRKLVDSLYARNETEFTHGTFRVRGDTVDVFPAYADLALRIVFFGDEIEEVSTFDPLSGQHRDDLDEYVIYPANLFVTTRERINVAVSQIQDDMVLQARHFRDTGRPEEAKRIEQRVQYDLEMIKELGYCSGIENYSRYFDGRAPGTRPFCLIDCFPKDFITIIDESHVTVPQIRAMYGGDHSRKQTLVEYGFRLPAALDNRPLRLEEFEALTGQTVYMSATPAEYEMEKSEGVFVDQVIRPTGLPDPPVVVRPSRNQVDDLMEEIRRRSAEGERVLVTTMTKRMAEELNTYLARFDIKCRYIHSGVETLERVEILEGLRSGEFDVLVGVNLLREGLDLPEVSLVAILDADKEGFLRSGRALTQTAGRAARNLNGLVVMYADRITGAMKETIDETNRRREKQFKYNEEMGITPRQIVRKGGTMLRGLSRKGVVLNAYTGPETVGVAADPVIQYMSREQLEKAVEKSRKAMEKAAAALDFIEAARLRDEIEGMRKLINRK
ncbi:MAG: excinuclease ABC subunit UvrB [Bacteroidales bacterium]